MKHILSWGLACILLVLNAACSDDGVSPGSKEGSGITSQTWQASQSYSGAGQYASFTFTAADKWKATSSSDFCDMREGSGGAGSATVKFYIKPNSTGAQRTATITVTVNGYSEAAKFAIEQTPGSSGSGEYADLNKQVDDYLAERYLWNDPYQTMSRDLSINYVSSSDNFLRNTLMQMTANTMDKKSNGSGGYSLYSYLVRTGTSTSAAAYTRGVNHGVKKQQEYSLGITPDMTPCYLNQERTKVGWAIGAVYPDSPAAEEGITRGWIVTAVNGVDLTTSNYSTYYQTLAYPSQSVTLKMVDASGATQTKTLAPRATYPNPVVHYSVLNEGGKKIGYIVYLGFDAAYDDDLLAAIENLKARGATEMVLDLRYNSGGHVISAQMLSSCIAGAQCSDQVFQYYTYNPTRMANYSDTASKTGKIYDAAKKKFYEKFIYGTYFGVNLTSYALNMNRMYVLVSGGTASASETVINSLQGIDINVTLIGVKTNGKNVGMEVKNITSKGMKYELAPITFQSWNAKEQTVSPAGIPVDYEVAEWNGGFVDFGRTNEPLLAKALNLITGQAYTSATRANAATFTTAATLTVPEACEDAPHRVRGMLVLPNEAEE